MQASDADRQRLADDLRTARRAMMHDAFIGTVSSLDASDLTLIQLASLLQLDDGAEHTVKEMAGYLGRSMSATSRLLDQMVRRRLIRRFEDPADRRARRVAIAEGGRRLVERLMNTRVEAQLGLMALLTPDERAHVARGMSLLAEAARRRSRGGE
jgi:DNA-binding MarR family transcriptional regulator